MKREKTVKDADIGNKVFQDSVQGAILHVHVQPRAAKTECVGLHGDALKVRVAAPPVDGIANEVLCRYLAEEFRVPKASVVVCSGQGGRRKRVLVKGVSTQHVRETLFFTDLPHARKVVSS